MSLVKSRKQQRKELRKAKKVKRNEFNLKKNKNYVSKNEQQSKVLNVKEGKKQNKPQAKSKGQNKIDKKKTNVKPLQNDDLLQSFKKEQNQIKQLKKDMNENRKKQLLEANREEDKNIRRLEKQLKLTKRKSKNIPKSFVEDGLDFLLEVCDPETMKNIAQSEMHLATEENEFEEDFALMTGANDKKESKATLKSKKRKHSESNDDDSDQDNASDLQENDELDDDQSDNEEESISGEDNMDIEDESNSDDDEFDMKEQGSNESDFDSDDGMPDDEVGQSNEKQNFKASKNKLDQDDEDLSENSNSEIDEEEVSDSNEETKKDSTVWEDIYGRLRTKEGEVVNNNTGKYIPPAIRAAMEAGMPEDKKRKEQLTRLKRTLKGLFNRLAESNMHGISRQIEDMYMNNSRNDVNDTITSLILESVVLPVNTPERLLLEHVMMITILHANVGTEVGAHFLQACVKRFNNLFNNYQEVEDKTQDNVVNIIAQLYNFQVCHSQLIYQILSKLGENFDEKSIECILLILRTVGFSLRKDNPGSLKEVILQLQKQSSNSSKEAQENARVKYMMDILLAIKNNNVRKIPNYDTTYSEHLKKLLKGFIRKGCYVTQLNISLEDLLKAEERGKWWVVGSAWTGTMETGKPTEKSKKSDKFSEKILELARKQRMNTDTRRNIFCNLLVAEDYLDAFARLLKLGLKGQEEREIMNVTLHCSLKESNFNPYYAVILQKFCEYDRKYQMMLKCSIWDKLHALQDSKSSQISNLAKLLSHLFLKKALPISMLKVLKFTELDKVTLRFMRQALLGVLLCDDFEECQAVFATVALSDKLKMFKESIRLFIQHFLLKNLNSGSIPENQRSMLTERAAIIDKLLVTHKRVKF